MARRSKRREGLTGEEWAAVFRIRCRSKSGAGISKEELALCEVALREDDARYRGMDDEIFRVTAPFGSSIREKVKDGRR
jgi:hypothetical protein